MSDNRDLFRDTAERIFADTVDAAAIEAAEQRNAPGRLFAALAQAGVWTMLAPEDQGGVGADLADAMAVLRAAGAAAAPGPLLETLLGQSLMARAGLPMTAGPLALAFVDDAAKTPPPLVRAAPWGGVADHLLVVVPGSGGARLFLTASSDWRVRQGADATGEPRDTMETRHAAALASGVASVTYERALSEAALLRAAQMLGAVEWVLARSVGYAQEREQFGKQIGAFQAVQHMLAELADHTLAAAAIVDAAAACVSPALVAAARSRLADAADAAIAIGHQAHGAIGFSRAYPLNYRTRRLIAWRDDYGSTRYWRSELAASFLGLGRDAIWPALADAGMTAA